MTTEQRLQALEAMQVTHAESAKRHLSFMERIVDLIEGNNNLIQGNNDLIAQNRQRIEQNDRILAEMRRENRQTRKIWIAIARKQKLFDDDEFRDVFGEQE